MNWPMFKFTMCAVVKKGNADFPETFVRMEEERVDYVYAPDVYAAEQFVYRRWEEVARQQGWDRISIWRTMAEVAFRKGDRIKRL